MLGKINTWFVNHPSILILIVPVLSGFVGWITVLYTTRRSSRSTKERMHFERLMKISEFRQIWINSLRDSMAEFQSYGVTPGHKPGHEREFYRLGTKIELLMNPNDPDYDKLQDSLYKFGNYIAKSQGYLDRLTTRNGRKKVSRNCLSDIPGMSISSSNSALLG